MKNPIQNLPISYLINKQARVYHSGDALSEDYIENRVNIELNSDQEIVNIWPDKPVLENLKTQSQAEQAPPVRNNFQAWYNMMPPGPPTLNVSGEIDFGNESESATLVFDYLLKKNPPILVLRVEPKHILIPRDPGDTKETLHFSQAAFPGWVDKIIIVYPNGDQEVIDNITIAV